MNIHVSSGKRVVAQGADPSPLSTQKAGRNHMNDVAKPYQIYVKQRSCADVDCELPL